MTWKACGSGQLPLTDKDREWDGDAARLRLFEWAGGEQLDARKAKRVFFAFDDAEPHQHGSYKLPFADVIAGELKAVPHAIYAVAGVLEGSRGGVDLPAAVQNQVRVKVTKYYKKLGQDPPW